MSPRFVLGRENVPCVAEVVNRSLKAERRFTPVGEGGSSRRPLPPQSLNILVGLTLTDCYHCTVSLG